MPTDKTVSPVLEFADLGRRLKAASPESFAQVVSLVRGIVDTHELVAEYDGQLFFRGSRPSKRYSA